MKSLLMKRLFDLVVVVLSAPVWCPAMLITALLVWARLGSPVFFRQLRPGHNGLIFSLVKFRTMTGVRGPDGKLPPDAERLPLFGRWLRSTSMDELPELWNVLKGEMSLVGPRPLLVQYLERYTPEQRRRHEVPPGLTGWAQINGRNEVSWEGKFALDVWYVENRNLFLDMWILARTVWQVLSRRGVSSAGEATAAEFNPQRESRPGGGADRP